MNGIALEKLISEYNSVQKMISRLSFHYPKILLKSLIYQKALTNEMMANEDAVDFLG